MAPNDTIPCYCSLVSLACSVGEPHSSQLMEMLAAKLVCKKGSTNDAACIGLKSVAAEVAPETGKVLAVRGIPVLRRGLPPHVRSPLA
jgi:hypothetical protein